MKMEVNQDEDIGCQRLSVGRLKAWQADGYGMFIHYGMSTYDGEEFSSGCLDASYFAPHSLDVDQWIRTAANAGMKYAVLTAKHVSGFCLWPSTYTEYHVGNSPAKIDIVQAFVDACYQYGVKPGLYYCLWDNRHRFGSVTPSDIMKWNNITFKGENATANPIDILEDAFVTEEAYNFFINQVTELLSNYGDLYEVWIDIPKVIGRTAREMLYSKIAALQPQTVIMMNNGYGDGTHYPVHNAWPADIMAIERLLPNAIGTLNPWRVIEGRRVYLPAEACTTIGQEWFYVPDDDPRSDLELLGMYLICRSRGVNFLLNVPPDRNGLIPENYVTKLSRLKCNIERIS